MPYSYMAIVMGLPFTIPFPTTENILNSYFQGKLAMKYEYKIIWWNHKC